MGEIIEVELLKYKYFFIFYFIILYFKKYFY